MYQLMLKTIYGFFNRSDKKRLLSNEDNFNQYQLLPTHEEKQFQSKNLTTGNIVTNNNNNEQKNTLVPIYTTIKGVSKKTKIDLNYFVELCCFDTFDKSTFADYSSDLIDQYRHDIFNNIIFNKLDKVNRIKVINTLLRLKKEFIFDLVNKINIFVQLLDLMDENTDVSAIDIKQQNFMFYVENTSIIKVLNSKLHFNINQQNIRNRSFLLVKQKIFYTTNNIEPLIQPLIKRGYDFNICSVSGLSLLSHIISNEIHLTTFKTFLQLPEIDITKEFHWLQLLIKHIDDIKLFHNLIYIIINRVDNQKFLYKMITKYNYPFAENDIIFVLNRIKLASKQRFNDMLFYTSNKNKNTFIHIAAIKHYKQVLRIIYHYLDKFLIKNLIKSNANGKYPHDLYQENKLSIKLN